MAITSWMNPCTKSALLAGALISASCGSLPIFSGPTGPARVEWSYEQPVFTTEAGKGKKVFLEWKDTEVVPEITTDIKQTIASVLQTKHGLTISESSEDADYFVQLQLRYFNGNEKADQGLSVVKAAGEEVGGGRPGWIIPGVGPIPEGLPVKPIGDLSAGTNKEWVLLIDVAVGEKGGDPNYPDQIALRRGRLVGYAPSKGLTHEDVLWLFKYGKLPPAPPEPVDGVIPASYKAPDPNAPPDALLRVLIPGILPLVN